MLECTQEMACQWISGQVISLQHIPHQLGEKNSGKQQQQKIVIYKKCFIKAWKDEIRKQKILSTWWHGNIKTDFEKK